MRSHWRFGAVLAAIAVLSTSCSSEDDPGLPSTACTPDDQCQACSSCFDACVCSGVAPVNCAPQCDPPAGGVLGCGQGNCAACTACYDTCYCQTGNPSACLAQCATGTGTGGATGSGGNVGTGGSGGTGAGGGTGGSSTGCPTPVSTGNQTCDACINGNCCSQAGSCFSQPACQSLASCLSQYCSNASNVSTCFQQYCSQYGSGANAYNALSQCVAGACPGAC